MGCHSFEGDTHYIDRSKCIHCGKCVQSCEYGAVKRDGKIIKSGTREEMAACAEGKTYIIDMDDLPKFKEPYYKQKQFDSDGKYYLRLVSSAPQDFAPVKPNVEDGYICALKGI